MPYLDDLPTLSAFTTLAGNDLLAGYDPSARTDPGKSAIKKLQVNAILGLLATDVTTVSGTSATISTRVTVCTSTSAVALTLPAASGDLRDIYVLKASATSTATISRAGSDVIVSGTAVNATSVAVTPGLAAHLMSDGTTWYHVSNDA